jgi:fused signal recognition particle receptor
MKEVKEEPRGILRRITEKTLSQSELEKILSELQIVLLENDVALETAERITGDVKKSLLGKTVKRGKVKQAVESALRDALLNVLSQTPPDLENRIDMKYQKGEPFVIVFLGFNGTGKTTTIAKFAYKFKHFKPVLAAGDTFRAASIEQLEEHAKKLGVDIVKHKYGADSAAVIFDAVKHAKAIQSALVLADTAGRSHSNANLMDELKKIVRVIKPDMKILVLDALAGNDIYDQSRLFEEAVGIDAIILTKADVYEKGGAMLSAVHTINKPILYIGVGQDYDDLREFDAKEIVDNLLG